MLSVLQSTYFYRAQLSCSAPAAPLRVLPNIGSLVAVFENLIEDAYKG